MKYKRWTKKEEEYLFSQISENPHNLLHAFKLCTKKYGRSIPAVRNHWYLSMRKKQEYNYCFMTIGKTHSLINGKSAKSQELINNKKGFFRRILNLFK